MKTAVWLIPIMIAFNVVVAGCDKRDRQRGTRSARYRRPEILIIGITFTCQAWLSDLSDPEILTSVFALTAAHRSVVNLVVLRFYL
jgi:hypothetical protein